MADNFLSEDDLNNILQGRFKNPAIKYVSSLMKPISEDAEGFMGEHYKLEIIYTLDGIENCEKLFLKTKPRNNQYQIDTANEAGVYKREIFLYDFLLKEFAKYGYDTSFSAQSYYCIPNQSLIMDDLTLKGYQLFDRHQKFSAEMIKCLLYSLAQFHAAGFAYDRTKSKELRRKFNLGKEYPEFFNELMLIPYENTKGIIFDFWNSSFQALYKIIDLLPYDEQEKHEFKDLLKQYKLGSSLLADTKLAKTCGHGDLWSNNMMFLYEDDTAVKCCLIDYQIYRYSYPALDVLLAIYFNTDLEYRKHHLDELYQYYYNTLSNILHKYGYNVDDIMPLSDFYESVEIVERDALLEVAAGSLLIYLPKQTLTDCVKQGGNSMQEIMFDKKSTLSVEAYQNDPLFRKVVIESMCDLRNALLRA